LRFLIFYHDAHPFVQFGEHSVDKKAHKCTHIVNL
jgi:hypothetical protein